MKIFLDLIGEVMQQQVSPSSYQLDPLVGIVKRGNFSIYSPHDLTANKRFPINWDSSFMGDILDLKGGSCATIVWTPHMTYGSLISFFERGKYAPT